jgi:hypothetical protein
MDATVSSIGHGSSDGADTGDMVTVSDNIPGHHTTSTSRLLLQQDVVLEEDAASALAGVGDLQSFPNCSDDDDMCSQDNDCLFPLICVKVRLTVKSSVNSTQNTKCLALRCRLKSCPASWKGKDCSTVTSSQGTRSGLVCTTGNVCKLRSCGPPLETEVFPARVRTADRVSQCPAGLMCDYLSHVCLPVGKSGAVSSCLYLLGQLCWQINRWRMAYIVWVLDVCIYILPCGWFTWQMWCMAGARLHTVYSCHSVTQSAIYLTASGARPVSVDYWLVRVDHC